MADEGQEELGDDAVEGVGVRRRALRDHRVAHERGRHGEHADEQSHHHGPPIGFKIYFNISWGLLAALYFLMIGYVSKDAPRRAMSSRFWMLICFVMPGGIGAVLYFLLRQPLVSRCPACSTFVQSDFHFCPQCDYQLTASCGKCYRTVRATDQFCTRCGHKLERDHMPARLRVL